MPWTVSDTNYVMRDDFFTTPFGHPSYVILAPTRLQQEEQGSGGMVVRDKFVGPCCGFIRYSDCQPETARQLDGTLSTAIDAIMQEMADMPSSESPRPRPKLLPSPNLNRSQKTSRSASLESFPSGHRAALTVE